MEFGAHQMNDFWYWGVFVLVPLYLGGVVAAVVARPETEISGPQFFSKSALAFLVLSTAQVIWLAYLPAMTYGLDWIIVLTWFLTAGAIGFWFCKLAMQRSRDAYGRLGRAFFAFIPLLNLWLLVKRPRIKDSATRIASPPIFSGGLGLITGLVLILAARGVDAFVSDQVRRVEEWAETQPEYVNLALEANICTQGLENTLREIAGSIETPLYIDDATSLTRVASKGTVLKRTYLIAVEDSSLSDVFLQEEKFYICTDAYLKPIFDAGGSITDSYVRQDGTWIGEVSATREECGF